MALGALFLELHLKFGERFDRELLARTAFAVAACVVSIGAGVSLIAPAGGGLYLLGVAGLIGLAMNVFGAWSLLIGLARE